MFWFKLEFFLFLVLKNLRPTISRQEISRKFVNFESRKISRNVVLQNFRDHPSLDPLSSNININQPCPPGFLSFHPGLPFDIHKTLDKNVNFGCTDFFHQNFGLLAYKFVSLLCLFIGYLFLWLKKHEGDVAYISRLFCTVPHYTGMSLYRLHAIKDPEDSWRYLVIFVLILCWQFGNILYWIILFIAGFLPPGRFIFHGKCE